MNAANDNTIQLHTVLDRAIAGQAITISQPHRKFGQSYAEFIGHVGDGKHVMVRKLVTSMWKSRWTKPTRVERSLVLKVHTNMAQPQ